MDSDLLLFVLGLLALPGVTSSATTLVRTVADVLGIPPRIVVYAVSVVLTGAILVQAGGALPAWAGDGPGFVAAWIAWAAANAELAKRVYDALIDRLYPAQT